MQRFSPILLALMILIPGVSANAADVQTITHGRAVDLEDHLVSGKYVLFDFYADWCGPCRAMEPQLLDLAGRHSDRLALRKVDIINWDSDVTHQYRISSIPYLILYGPDGSRLAAGDPGTVLRRLQSGLGGSGGGSPIPTPGPSIIPILAIAAIFAVTVAFVARKRRSPEPIANSAAHVGNLAPPDTVRNSGDPAIWFALLQGSLEGPFTREQIGELVSRGTLRDQDTIRRRGDASWTTIANVLD